MGRLKLDLADLEVESFAADAGPATRGTVRARGDIYDKIPATDFDCDFTDPIQTGLACTAFCTWNTGCWRVTCVSTCAGPTCNATCPGTCFHTCQGSCDNTCNYTMDLNLFVCQPT